MARWDTLFHEEEFRWKEPRAQVPRYAEQFSAHRHPRVLDLGCGAGRHVVYPAGHGFQMTGLEAAHEWLEKERLRAGLLRGDMTALPFFEKPFSS